MSMAESKMPARRIMFCCESCADNYPEGCGYFDRDDLRVMPNGIWLCDGCFTDCDAYDYGFRDLDEDEEITKPDWLDLPVPPALVPADLVEPLVEALDDLQRVTRLHLDTSDGSELGYLHDVLCTARAALSSWEAAPSGQAQTEARRD